MPVLDAQGRVFGRMNLIDAAVAVFVLVLIPVGYGSWALFRTPPPVIESVESAGIAPGEPDQQIVLHGRYFRPFLYGRVGSQSAQFLFESADRAQLRLPALEPGTYDVALFDSKEIAHYTNGFTVKPAQVVEIDVRFVTRPEVVEEVARQQRSVPPGGARDPSTPALVSYEVVDELVGTTKDDLRQGKISIVKGRVRVTAAWTSNGWKAGETDLKAGALFTLTMPTYVLEGQILNVAAVDAPK